MPWRSLKRRGNCECRPVSIWKAMQLHGARRLHPQAVVAMRMRSLAVPGSARIVATWIELDLPLRDRERHELERALTKAPRNR